jgi:hypothetical protein
MDRMLEVLFNDDSDDDLFQNPILVNQVVVKFLNLQKLPR